MKTIIYEKIPSMFALTIGFLNFFLVKFKDNILVVLVLLLMLDSNKDNKGQIVLSFPVDTPGTTYSSIISRTEAASLPAIRIFSMSSFVVILETINTCFFTSLKYGINRAAL